MTQSSLKDRLLPLIGSLAYGFKASRLQLPQEEDDPLPQHVEVLESSYSRRLAVN